MQIKENQNKIIVYQGEPGSNSHLACQDAYPEWQAKACQTFEDAMSQVKNGKARRARSPVEKAGAGRVADVHHLLPDSGLFVVGEHFERIRFQLLGLPSATLDKIKTVHSHVMALGQCRNAIRELGLTPIVEADTAGSARMVAESGDLSQAAIAPGLAGELHGRNRGFVKRLGYGCIQSTEEFANIARPAVGPENLKKLR